MEGYCKYCGHAIEDASPEAIGRALTCFCNLHYWVDYSVGTEKFVPGLGTVTVVYNSYLEVADDGGPIKLVWETQYGPIGVEGYYDSYSGIRWESEFKKAEKKTKEVVYYE